MQYQDLNPKMRELLKSLEEASLPIEYDIKDALESAATEEEFVLGAVGALENLAQEADWWGKSILKVSEVSESG